MSSPLPPLLVFLILFIIQQTQPSPCDYFKPFIGKVPTCTPTASDYLLEVNPGATAFGGQDVSAASCHYVSESTCCGIYPRWNWVLGGCEPDMSPGQACYAAVQNTSAYDLYYIAAYQWNGNSWILDTTSSVFGGGNGQLINNLPSFEKLKIDGKNSPHPAGGDWQAKWAPRTATTNTQGLGPPAFMFVLSAKKLQWMTFYSLVQKTINRGPENQFSPSGYTNCWYAELDFLEAPFWSPSCYYASHPYASFSSTGAQFGGCFPMGVNIGDNFASSCTTEWCCEGTACGSGFKPFINSADYGEDVAGCASQATSNPPAGTQWCGLSGNPGACSDFRALGGCASNSFFENDPNTEYMFTFLVEKTGIYSYRWIANTESQADAFWPGLHKYTATTTLTSARPATRPSKTSVPCLSGDASCVIFHPSSTGERPCVTAAGNEKLLQSMGVAAAAGNNWWDLFEETGNWWGYDSSVVPGVFSG